MGVPLSAGAQGVRGDFRVSASFLDYLTVVRRSLPESEVPGNGSSRVLPDGTVVTCIPGLDCYWYEAGVVQSGNSIVQDLRLTVWPGARGISGRVDLRGRYGSDGFWPENDREFEVRNLYLDFERPVFRVRAGRQVRTAGLGAYSFDGAALLWRGLETFRVEGYAGRSLGRTVNQARTGSLLAETEELPPDDRSDLLGIEGRLRLGRDFSGSLLYQREIREDRASLTSERMALDARYTRPSLTAGFSAAFDVAYAHFNEARLEVTGRPSPTLSLTGTVRHYRPFFELWTIWGAFSPVGYNEIRGAALVQAGRRWALDFEAAYRDYEETNAGAEFLPVIGDGWRGTAGASYAGGGWETRVSGTAYRGPGGYRGTLDLSGGREFPGGAYAGLFASGTQIFAEFRIGENQMHGAGVEARVPVGWVSLDGRAGLYRHSFEDRPGYDDYNQFRGRLGLTATFGTEPAVPRNKGRGIE
jgi:hypothetical protein